MESIKTSIIKWTKQYLVNQKSAPPLLFFLIIIYANLVPQDNGFIILHFFALSLAIITKFNFLFLLPSFIYTSNYFLVALFFATSAIFSNKKWKLYLFIYSIMDTYFIFNQTNPYFIAIASLFLTILTYKNLVFQTQNDNKQYFVGFFIITTVNTANLIFNSFDSHELYLSSLIAIAFSSGIVSYIIISNRFESLRKSDADSIKEAKLITLYLNILKSDLEVPSIKKAKLEIHSKHCNKPFCFCKNSQHSSNISYFSRQIYEDTIKDNNHNNQESLSEQYIDFLIANKQATNALYYLQNWKTQSYFAFLTRLKCQAKIQSQLDNQNSSNPYEKQYIYGLQYDEHCLMVATKIYQILKMKINFWKEVSKEVLSLYQLKQMGCTIVEKMYELNKFYNIHIKKYEKTLYSFDATVLYSMYLISTTNFKDYAKGIIKSTAKLMEEVFVSQGNVCEIFAIRTVVKKVNKSFIRQYGSRFQAQQKLQTKLRLQASYQNQFRLVIDRVSNGFCRLLNMEKSLLQGLQLNSIIPDGYKEVHNTRLSYLLDFKSEALKQIVASKVFHNQLKLPFKGKNNQILSGIICIKYQVDIEQGLTFVSIIKKVPDRKCQALLTFDGKITQMEKGFLPEIVQHSQVKQYLNQLRSCWEKERIIKEQKFNMIINSQNYQVTISSPLLILFLEKQNLRHKEPPIHIQFINEENNKFKNMSVFGNNHQADYQIKKMQKMLIHYDQESSTTSTKGINSAVTVISNFSQNNSVPVYKYIILTFIAIILCSIALNLILNFLTILQWDNSLPNNNPIFDNLDTYLLQILQTKAVLHLQDQKYYNQHKNLLNISKINSYYPPPTYLQSSITIFKNLQKSWSTAMTNLFGYSSSLLQSAIKNRFNQPIIIKNDYDNESFIQYPIENLTYLQILSIYGTDFNLATEKNDIKELLISSMYQQAEQQLSDPSVFSNIIDDSISTSRYHQIIMGVSFSIFLGLLLIPMHIVLKKRYQAHQRVFDLLSSIDCEQVQRQIESLLYISNILSNYDQSQEKLKTNVLQYESNKIKPKHSDSKRRPSVQNQIVLGLSKFDVNRNIPLDSAQPVHPSKERHVTVLFQYKTIFQMIKKEMFKILTQQSAIKKRKRSGELELAGSQYERNLKPSANHCIIYILLLSFTFLLIGCMVFNLNFIQKIQQTKNTTTSAYQALQCLNTKLYKAKFFIWEGSSSFQHQFSISNQLSQLTQIILDILNFSKDNKESYLIPPSSIGNVKLNQYTTSYLMLQSKMESLLKNLIQYRYNLDRNDSNNSSTNSEMFLNNYQKIFYLQSLNTQIEEMIEQITKAVLSNMINYSLTTSNQKTIFLVCVVVWSVISMILGLIVIISMKKQFFKEVYIITFLNDEMVMKNKRVESYLETLSKNTYL